MSTRREPLSREKLQELLTRARAAATPPVIEKLAEIEQQADSGVHIDLSAAGITPESIQTDAGLDAAADVMKEILEEPPTPDVPHTQDAHKSNLGVARTDIVYNVNQQAYVDAVVNGTHPIIVLVGAAGTGKTTCQRGAAEGLLASGRVGELSTDTKWLKAGLPGVVICSYTRKATNNIRHAMPDIIKPHTITIHKLLEFAPFFYEIEDPANPGQFKKTMRFEPTRTRLHPLPSSLRFIGFEESSMISVELYNLLMNAIPHKIQQSFLGDIQQLPPIFGSAILGFKMLECPVIELTDVYRQALDSPIISLAWDILRGDPAKFSSVTTKKEKIYNSVVKKELERISVGALDAFNVPDKLRIHYLQKKISADLALLTLAKQFNDWSDSGFYNAADDIILIPFNKAFGTIELNKGIQQHLGVKREATVHEVIAGFNKHYLAVGDRVLYDKEDAFITNIARNSEYFGKSFQPASKLLDRWGHMRDATSADAATPAQDEIADEFDLVSIDKFLEHAANADEDRVNCASHCITVQLAHTDEEVLLETANDINNLIGGNAITVHKAQGSEWERVFFIMHNSHAVMNQRELLYTAVTRARSFLYILCEVDTFEKGIMSQRIIGNTLAEKAEFFKGKKKDLDSKRDLLSAERDRLEANGIKTTIGGAPAVRIEDLVPADVQDLIRKRTDECWQQAKIVFASQLIKLGNNPEVRFDLNSRNFLGVAYLSRNLIKYNPVWLGCDDGEVLSHFMQETVPHEVCHHIAYRLYRDKGHGYWWRECMKKMGLPPNRISSKPMPDYFSSKQEKLRLMFEQFKVALQSDSATLESTTNDEGD